MKERRQCPPHPPTPSLSPPPPLRGRTEPCLPGRRQPAEYPTDDNDHHDKC